MRTYDFSPLYRSTVGFDRLFDLLDHAARVETNWPPYNIEKLGENEYRITMAVAGFAPEEIELVQQQNSLFVTGQKRGPTRAGSICIAASRPARSSSPSTSPTTSR